jgi:hypothetical protein
MGAEKTIVLTTFGQGETVERISVSVFDVESNGCSRSASNYCKTINSLELKDGTWIFARIAGEHAQFTIKRLVPVRTPFRELIPQLDDRYIQKFMREVDSLDLAMALKGTDSKVQDKIFRNMSKRGAGMLKEDMEFMSPVRMSDVEARQEKLADIIQNLEAEEEIVISNPEDELIN